MKKVFWILIVVFVIAAVAAGKSETIDYYKAKELIDEWIVNEPNREKWKNFESDGTVAYGYGVVSLSDMTSEAKKPIENVDDLVNYAKECSNLCESKINIIGYIEGYPIYQLDGQSETTAVGYDDGEYYYCASLIFILCE